MNEAVKARRGAGLEKWPAGSLWAPSQGQLAGPSGQEGRGRGEEERPGKARVFVLKSFSSSFKTALQNKLEPVTTRLNFENRGRERDKGRKYFY